MATIYDLGHYLDPTNENAISASPAWVIAVVRFKYKTTFSREKMQSLDLDGSITASERSTLVITSDCTQVMASSNKGSHVKNLVAQLKPGKRYGAEILPDDWVFCWMVKHRDQAADLIRRIRNKQPCNGFMDGLKFVGRAYSCQKQMMTNENGIKEVSYSLVCNGFTEFNSQVFWDPSLSVAQPLFNTWMGNFGVAFNKFLSADGIDVNGAIPELMEILFGRGISKQAANPAGELETQIITGATAGEGEAEFAYVVPETVGTLLGRRSRSKRSGVLAYADLLQALYGVQKYDDLGGDFQTNSDILFTDEGKNEALGRIFQPSTLKPMLGRFVPAIPQLSGRSAWSVLGQYLNPAVNEMYTCLRANEEGKIVPTLVVRQLPFTSKLMEADDRTGFLELPRWKARDSMIISYGVGRSNALRFNFVHLTGQAAVQAQPNIMTYQLVRSPPVRDDHDIRRAGLHPDMQTVACGVEDNQLGPKKWTEIRADILMGQHLTLTGTINMTGVQEPIVEGDNFEYDGVVFHIEGVTHTCAITEGGKKSFMTTLQVSHGINADPEPVIEVVPDDAIFVTDEALTTHDGGHTHEAEGLSDFFTDEDEEEGHH